MDARALGTLALLLVLGCEERAGDARAERTELLVYAAASTRDALAALEAPYEREHAADLVFNFGSSGTLARQIVAAAKADVFLSADEAEMDAVERAGLVATGTRRPLLSNRLVVVEPVGRPSAFTEPFDAGQLAAVELLSLADVEAVPAGKYAKAWLEARGVWDAVRGRVLPALDVRGALAAVESGAAGAGIVYRTDVAHSTRARIVHEVPIDEGPAIAYPVAAIAGRPHEREAREFLRFLASDAARAAFEREGFVVLPAPGDGG